MDNVLIPKWALREAIFGHREILPPCVVHVAYGYAAPPDTIKKEICDDIMSSTSVQEVAKSHACPLVRTEKKTIQITSFVMDVSLLKMQ